MKIPLIYTYLKIEISRKPKISKLKKELSNFFDKNEISGIKIDKFNLSPSTGDPLIQVNSEKDYFNIIDIYPEIDNRKLFAETDHSEEIERIGRKYNIHQLRFSLSCYGK